MYSFTYKSNRLKLSDYCPFAPVILGIFFPFQESFFFPLSFGKVEWIIIKNDIFQKTFLYMVNIKEIYKCS